MTIFIYSSLKESGGDLLPMLAFSRKAVSKGLTFLQPGWHFQRTSGKALWICSASESLLLKNKVGGMPVKKSSGLDTSMSTFKHRTSPVQDISRPRLFLPIG
jgi:hypothetical protein